MKVLLSRYGVVGDDTQYHCERLLRIRRLGVRVPPSALEKTPSEQEKRPRCDSGALLFPVDAFDPAASYSSTGAWPRPRPAPSNRHPPPALTERRCPPRSSEEAQSGRGPGPGEMGVRVDRADRRRAGPGVLPSALPGADAARRRLDPPRGRRPARRRPDMAHGARPGGLGGDRLRSPLRRRRRRLRRRRLEFL